MENGQQTATAGGQPKQEKAVLDQSHSPFIATLVLLLLVRRMTHTLIARSSFAVLQALMWMSGVGALAFGSGANESAWTFAFLRLWVPAMCLLLLWVIVFLRREVLLSRVAIATVLLNFWLVVRLSMS